MPPTFFFPCRIDALTNEHSRAAIACKVILSSDYNEQDATQHFTGKGLAGFIQKPFTIATLGAKLREVL